MYRTLPPRNDPTTKLGFKVSAQMLRHLRQRAGPRPHDTAIREQKYPAHGAAPSCRRQDFKNFSAGGQFAGRDLSTAPQNNVRSRTQERLGHCRFVSLSKSVRRLSALMIIGGGLCQAAPRKKCRHQTRSRMRFTPSLCDWLRYGRGHNFAGCDVKADYLTARSLSNFSHRGFSVLWCV